MILLEREWQLRQLHEILTETALGRGRVAALTGEAGAGKTSLVDSFAHRIAGDARVFRGACEDLSIPDPLGPLHDLARNAGWKLSRSADGRQGGQMALFSEAIEVFETPTRPTLLVIEDLHWADDATLDFVRYVGRRISNMHLLLLLTARTGDSAGQRRMRRALGDIPADNVLRIDVPLLSEAAVATLARGTEQDAQAIYRATAGNAFFVTEMLRASGQLPPSVRDAVLARAERLSAGARRVLDAASVFPRRAEAAALRAVCGQESTDHVAECVAAGMLVHTNDAYAFRHEIARHAVEVALPEPLRQDLNGRALAALRELGEVPTARLVHHAVEAHDLDAVRVLAPRAAAEASSVSAHREAAAHYRTALEISTGLALADRAVLLERYAFECHLVGRMQDAIEAQGRALELHRSQGDRQREGDCLRWLSRLSYLNGDREAADRYGEQTVALLEAVGPGPELAMAYSNRAHLAMLAAQVGDVLDDGRRAIALAEAFDRPDILCHALNNIGTAEQWRDPARGREHLDRSLSIALDRNFQEHAARAFTNRACLEINLLEYKQAHVFLRAGIDYCAERDLDTWRDYMTGWLAELLLREGRWDEAADAAQPVVTNGQAALLVRFPAVMALARLRLRRGDPAAAPLFEELARFLEKGMELQRLAPYATLVAERAWLGQADAAEALRLIDRAEAMAPSRFIYGELAYWRRALAPEGEQANVAGLAEPYRAQVAGDWRQAAEMWEKIGAPFERALALLAGDEAAQRTALGIFESLGARPVAQRVRGALRRSGVGQIARGPRRTTRANSAGLTEREMEVLGLVGRGLSNKRIAQQLGISPKTVDHHVSAILGKLGAASRGEAIVAALQTGLVP